MNHLEAQQLILDKATSLSSGWKLECEAYGGVITRHYSNPALPGVWLSHEYDARLPDSGNVTLRVATDLHFIASSAQLEAHLEVVKQSVQAAEKLAMEQRIIEIAERIESGLYSYTTPERAF